MQITVKADIFHRALKSTAFAASRDFDPRRPAFSGVLLDASPTKFRVVATDGYRLALFETDDGYDCREPMTAILSARELSELKLPRALGTVIKIAANDTEAVIQHEKAGFSVPVIQARYPNYFAVFPPIEGSVALRCEKAEFVKALIAARQKTTRKNRSVFFWIRPGFIAVAAENANTISPVRIEARSDYSMDGIADCNYLLDAAQALPTGDVQIRIVPPYERRLISNAIELSPVVQSPFTIRQLVMPCWRSSIPPLPGVDS
jgi:DNA polymerase III sliding clamp (beta) subunit (PCNA family)